MFDSTWDDEHTGIGTLVPGSSLAAVGDAGAVLGGLASVDATGLSDDELFDGVLGLERARRFLDASEAHLLAELDRRGTTDERAGQRTAVWLRHEAKLPPSVAAARVKTARKLSDVLPDVDASLASGVIGWDHARVYADATNDRNATDMASVASIMCDAAEETAFSRWAREVNGLGERFDQDGECPGDDLDSNRLTITGTGDTWVLKGQLIGDVGLITESAINQVADELFDQYTRDAKLTPNLQIPDRATLRALALAELCRRGLATDLGSSRPPNTAVTFVMNAAEPDVITDEHGCILDHPSFGMLLCDPVLQPIVMSMTGQPLHHGRDKRFPTRAQRRAAAHRDGGCVFPGCDAPAAWTDLHHVEEWDADDGETDITNLACLCRRHHGVAHRDGWTMYATDDGWFHWTTPSGDTFWSQRHHRQRAGPTPTVG